MAGSSTVSEPSVTVQLLSAPAAVQNAPQKILCVGQIDSGALTTDTPTSAGAGEWVRNIENGGAEDQLFGSHSQLAEMVRACKLITTRVQIDAIALDDGAGTGHTKTITITGSQATAGATLKLIVGSEKLAEIEVGILVDDTPTLAGDSIVTAVNANANTRFFASNAVGVVTLTAINDGTVANSDPIGIEGLVPGLTIGAVTDGAVGATDPTTTNILDAIGDERYQTIIWPYPDTADDVGTLLTNRFNINNAVLDGVAFIPMTDTFSQIGTDLASSNFNNPSIVVIAAKQETTASYIGPSMPESTFRTCAMFGAVRALRLSQGEAISKYLTTSAPRDQFGGPALASLPYFNTIFPDLPTPRAGLGWTSDEAKALLLDGAGIIGQNSAGSAVISGSMPTTYLTNGGGNPDSTWHYLNSLDTASQVREYMANNLKATYGQSRLTDGATPAGRDIANDVKIKSKLNSMYGILAGDDYTLTRDGQEQVDYFRDSIVIDVTLSTGTVIITMEVPIVVQLREINASMTIVFDLAA